MNKTTTSTRRPSWPALINALTATRGQIGHLLCFSFAINLLSSGKHFCESAGQFIFAADGREEDVMTQKACYEISLGIELRAVNFLHGNLQHQPQGIHFAPWNSPPIALV